MIDLWEDIGPWSKSSNPERVKFTYMLPNTLPRQYVEVASDATLLEIFRENRRSKMLTLYVLDKKDGPIPSISLTSQITSEIVDVQNLQQDSHIQGVDELQAFSLTSNHFL
ncbi:hypothetical protein QJS10_CPA16g00722 [Acorus calamus]|uniref:Uncharacterized protein n=1 Tax=Acorus calamus TaxID=4465 RepID=A0AAV9CZ78_ACOCL|nr:hypothetical protein QJS10_CPA16g00722 [Acorus calamus]